MTDRLLEIQKLINQLKDTSRIEKEWISIRANQLLNGDYKNKQDYELKRGYIIRFAYVHPENQPIIEQILKLLETEQTS